MTARPSKIPAKHQFAIDRIRRELKGTMSDINNYVLTGRLVSRPHHDENENGVALFIIASNHRYRDKRGNIQQETLFLPCKAFGGWARALDGRQKGEMLLLSGRLRSECWEQDGETQKGPVLVCASVRCVKVSTTITVENTSSGSNAASNTLQTDRESDAAIGFEEGHS